MRTRLKHPDSIYPENETPQALTENPNLQNIDSIIATIDDELVRRLLIGELKS